MWKYKIIYSLFFYFPLREVISTEKKICPSQNSYERWKETSKSALKVVVENKESLGKNLSFEFTVF